MCEYIVLIASLDMITIKSYLNSLSEVIQYILTTERLYIPTHLSFRSTFNFK